MVRAVAVGVDGSPESMAAVEWAASEAKALNTSLRVICAQGGWALPRRSEDAPKRLTWAQDQVRAAAGRAGALYPSGEIVEDVVSEAPARALLEATAEAEVLAIGSRGLGAFAGFVVGSVGLSVLAHTTRPVVAVRVPERGGTASGPVVAAVDLAHETDEVLGFAFQEAALRGVPVRIAHAWSVQSVYAFPSALPDPEVVREAGEHSEQAVEVAVRPWRERYPEVETEDLTQAAAVIPYLLEVSSDAGMIAVGRRTRGHPFPTRIGSVAHAVLHHVHCPVAVVPQV